MKMPDESHLVGHIFWLKSEQLGIRIEPFLQIGLPRLIEGYAEKCVLQPIIFFYDTTPAPLAKKALTHSVVTDLGRSSGRPSARAQHWAANTPSERLTPNITV